jgi:predicted metal-dependent HD superfamily phosphohydrolase
MYNKFKSFWDKMGCNPNLCRLNYEILKALYSSRGRHYHTFEHIKMCLNELEICKEQMPTFIKLVVEKAIWFHDAIYVINENIDNELLSWQFADQLLASHGVSRLFLKDLILATKHEETLIDSFETKIMADIDLAIFGKDKHTFDNYEENIRKEYEMFNEKEYKEGRKKVLKYFLDKKQIYYTEYFKNKYEDQARKNLQRIYEQM